MRRERIDVEKYYCMSGFNLKNINNNLEELKNIINYIVKISRKIENDIKTLPLHSNNYENYNDEILTSLQAIEYTSQAGQNNVQNIVKGIEESTYIFPSEDDYDENAYLIAQKYSMKLEQQRNEGESIMF